MILHLYKITITNMDEEVTILVMGACCMDRSIPVNKYPKEDTKTRSSGPIVESGGGNGANTACAIARLLADNDDDMYESNNGQPHRVRVRVKLLSSIGDDSIGERLVNELRDNAGAGVDLTSPLFCMRKGTTTSLTTIIVTNDDDDEGTCRSRSSRTCIHTPGTCGELTFEDIKNISMSEIFAGNVVHFHSDSRHTSAATLIAEEAKRRRINVSVDAEKDRGVGDFDKLLELADLLFTNQDMCKDYFYRSSSKRTVNHLRSSFGSKSFTDLEQMIISQGHTNKDTDEVRAKKLLQHFITNYNQTSKHIIATRGSRGCYSVTADMACKQEGMMKNNENIRFIGVGIVPCRKVMDTTGAGDAFIGGYLASSVLQKIITTDNSADTVFLTYLHFASWVASCSIQGIGRSTLPSRKYMRTNLGQTIEKVSQSLERIIQ